MRIKNMGSLKTPYQVWLCDLTHTNQTLASEFVPIQLGLLSSYSKKELGGMVQFRLFKLPEKLIQNLLLGQPRIIGFSNYIWNFDLSYLIAKKIKEISPQTVVVFGGPNFPIEMDEQKKFLKKRKAIDFYVFGEGEIAFHKLLLKLIEHNFDIEKVKKLSPENYLSMHEDNLICGPMLQRIDIKETPSPYLEGILDEFLDENFVPLIQTCRGCPFTCSYCTEGESYFNQITFREPREISAEIEYIAQKNKDNKKLFIADSNFGQYKQDLETARAIRRTKEKYGYPEYINVATGKENKERVIEVAKILKGDLRIGGAVQSTDPVVLKNIRRKNVSMETLFKLVKMGNQAGANTYSEIILALPGDTKQAHFKSIETVINHGFNFIRLYTLLILRGCSLYSKKTREEFGIVTKYRVLPRNFGIYKFGKDRICSAEIEEVCVANNTLNFNDYLDCRQFGLTIELFYNDGIFSELLFFLKRFGISQYNLMEKIHNDRHNFPPHLLKLYKVFCEETANELWDSYEELEEHVKNEEIIQKYINGEYGSNLIFKYKSLFYTKYISEMHDIIFKIAEKLIIEKKEIRDPQDSVAFLSELKRYSLLRKKEILNVNKVFSSSFVFDVEKMNLRGFNSFNFDDFKLKTPMRIEFKHDEQQSDMIKRSINQFGTTTVGISRILSRVYVKKMYRKTFVL